MTFAPAFMLAAMVAAAAPPLPIATGHYTFRHRFAEQPHMSSISLRADISGRHIVLVNEGKSGVFPHGVVAEGTLMWNVASRQWIIGRDSSDRLASEVGGCSEGPEVVDLVRHVYWTC